MIRHSTLGAAKETARKNTRRDECEWVVWYLGEGYSNPYASGTVVERPEYSFWKCIWSTKQDKKAAPAQPNAHAVILTDEEKTLLEFILRPESYDRDVYPGSDEVKNSLWKKIKVSIHA